MDADDYIDSHKCPECGADVYRKKQPSIVSAIAGIEITFHVWQCPWCGFVSECRELRVIA